MGTRTPNIKFPKLPSGCPIAAGIVTLLCAGIIAIIVLAIASTPSNPEPTPIQNSIGTAAFETAVAINLQTIVGPNPTSTSTQNTIGTSAFETAVAINLQTLVASNPTTTPTLRPTVTTVPAQTSTSQSTATSAQMFSARGASCIPNNSAQTGKVVEVIDGDTIKVLLDEDGKVYSVRYIGMDTPEDSSQGEYFGPEAKAKNTEFVSGKEIYLIKDVSEIDKYGRLLRYVLTNDFFVNYELVAQGYATTVSYPPDVSCIPTFLDAEQMASAAELGLWAEPPTQAPLPTATSTSSGGSGGNVPCNCGGLDLDCSDFGSHSAAQTCFDYCRSQSYGDVFRLEGDNDGSACESLP
jgi:micrococcal nuclease